MKFICASHDAVEFTMFNAKICHYLIEKEINRTYPPSGNARLINGSINNQFVHFYVYPIETL